MLYMEYMQKAKDLVIEQHDNGMWYLVPEWRYVLASNNLALIKFRDFRTDWYAIEDNLKLEVEKRNAAESKLNSVMNWVNEVVSTTVDAATIDEENELISNAIKYMKMSHEVQIENDLK